LGVEEIEGVFSTEACRPREVVVTLLVQLVERSMAM